MNIHTLWKQWDDDSVELLFALDEYTVEVSPEAWEKGLTEACERYGILPSDTREVIVTVSGDAIKDRFEIPTIPGTITE